MRKLLARVWPMKPVVPHYFADVVTGKSVGIYRDIIGRYWMAEHRFSIFRVRFIGESQ